MTFLIRKTGLIRLFRTLLWNIQRVFQDKSYFFLGSSAVDGKRFLESNASSIRGTLT